MEFPQYRKLSNEKSFYIIENDRTFTEIQILGKSTIQHKIEAKQYPEILRIKEMLDFSLFGIELATKEEVIALLKT